MLYVFAIVLCLGLVSVALFYFLKTKELDTQVRQLEESWQERETAYTSELAKLEKLRHIPDIIERARRTKDDIEAKLLHAQKQADEILLTARHAAQEQSQNLKLEVERRLGEATKLKGDAEETLKVARWQAQNLLEEVEKEARLITSKARKDAKEKRDKVVDALNRATTYALDIRRSAEDKAKSIAVEAFEARGRLKEYEALEIAYKNKIKGYEDIDLVPPVHLLDELAEEFGFDKAGERLKLARERTRLMEKNGTAATCHYPDGWKKDHALKFVLSTFNGKVDTIISRIKPGNQGKLIQELKDAYAFVNKDGEVYKDARIQEEYLDSRLDEIKWAVAVQKLKEKMREEQRSIREQIREEERTKREIEKAIKQAEREEDLVNKAIEKIKTQFEEAGEAEKAKLEAQLTALNARLIEAEEMGRKAISMAQQTKKGNVYIISNVGSFGENVYKIGLSRRLDPTERVKELGDASVPFPFDVHAMLASDDAPALEAALHRRFLEQQVNKINKRKEFFKVGLKEIRQAAEEMGLQAVWTLEAEASQYRETLALEQAMRTNQDLKSQWLQDQATFDFTDESLEDAELEEVEA